MSNEYQLADGSPRYGTRQDTPGQVTQGQQAAPIRADEAAEKAARLDLDHLAAAIDRRLTSVWADKEDPLIGALRKDHAEELAAARALVRLHLGSQRQWRLKAQGVRDRRLADTLDRRKASGSALEIFLLRVGLILALIAPPVFIIATDRDNLVKLVLTGAVCVAAAFIGGYALTVRSRVPAMPVIRGPWLNELREDIVNATLVGILHSKGAALDARTTAAGLRGWGSILTAVRAVDTLHA